MQHQINVDADPRLRAAAEFILDEGLSRPLSALHNALGEESGHGVVEATYRLAETMDEYFFMRYFGDLHLVRCLGMKSNVGDVRADVLAIETIDSLHHYLDLLILGHILRAMLKRGLEIHSFEDLVHLRSFSIDTFVNMIEYIKEEEAKTGDITPEEEFMRLMLNTKDAIVEAINKTTALG